LLERTRREGVNELILTPIAGFGTDDYLDPDKQWIDVASTELSSQIKHVLEDNVRYFRQAAQKMPNEAAVRVFTRLAVKKEKLLSA